MGRDKSTPTHWTQGRTEPDLATVAELLEISGRRADWLFGLSQPVLELRETPGTYETELPPQERIDGAVDAKALDVRLNAFMDEMRQRVRGIEKTVEKLAEAPKRRAR